MKKRLNRYPYCAQKPDKRYVDPFNGREEGVPDVVVDGQNRGR